MGNVRHTLGLGTVIRAVARRPILFFEAVRSYFATRKRTGPFPSHVYLSWRSYTAYGSVVPMPADDFYEFMSWRRQMRRLRGTG